MLNHDHISDRMLHGAETRQKKADAQKTPSLGRERGIGGNNPSAKPCEGHFRSADDQENHTKSERGAK